ncbi:MAG: bifunctional diguanylate cyclase/phosphodiesterase [Pseudomonadota bacterium]
MISSDPMLSLPVRRLEFFQSLSNVFQHTRQNDDLMALIVISLDRYQDIEQNFGYEKAESYLSAAYSKLNEGVNVGGEMYRINSAQIALLIPSLKHRNFLLIAANKVLSVFDKTTAYETYNADLDLTLGLSVSQDQVEFGGLSGDVRLYQQANASLLTAKEHQRTFMLPSFVQQDAPSPISSERIERAFSKNEMKLYFQPKLNIRRHAIEGVEALLRWQTEDDLFVPPSLIIEHMERNINQNFKFTKWVINTALRQQKEWLSDGIELCVSVNVSAQLVSLDDTVDMLKDALTLWDVPADLLMLEITETALMLNMEKSRKVLHDIKQLGVKLSIDDFGTGYSSLAYFKDIPAHELKVDRALIKDIMNNDSDRILVQLIIELGHSFGLQVVVEGVDDQQSFDFLTTLECDYIQGYYISKALPARDISDIMNYLPKNG